MRFRFADIRPGERQATLAAFLLLFGAMAAHILLETGRDALFLAKLEAKQLPFVYLAIAFLSLPISSFQSRSRRRGGKSRSSLGVWFAFAGLFTLVLWSAVGRFGTWVLYVLYVWSGIFSTVTLVRFWILMGDLFTVTQAKRVFTLIGTGSILGATTGSLIAQFIALQLESRHLLLAPGLLLLLTAALTMSMRTGGEEKSVPRRLALPEGEAPPRESNWGETFERIRHHPYLTRVAAIVLFSAIAFTVTDFVFKSVVRDLVIPPGTEMVSAEEAALAADRLAWFFATAYLVLNVLALVAQVTVVGWMTRHLAVSRLLSFLPILFLLSSAWLIVGGGVFAALLLKGVDGTFRHSLHRTAMEVLYVPLSGEWKAKVKTFIDVLGQRGGQTLASFGILALTWGGLSAGFVTAVLGVTLVLFTVGWIAAAFGLRRHYVELFRATLREGSTQTRIGFPDLDLASLEALIGALSSPDENEVVAALDLLGEQKRVHLVPALILYHPSARVLRRALDLFGEVGRDDHFRLVEQLLEHPDPDVRVSALIHRKYSPDDAETLDKCMRDELAEVRATALIGVLKWGLDTHPRVRSVLDTTISFGSREAKRALAVAIYHCPAPMFDDVLLRLAEDPDPLVLKEVARAMEPNRQERFLPALLSMLKHRVCRTEARQTMALLKDQALEFLEEALADESLDLQIHRHLPRTLKLFDPEQAARILLARMLVEQDGLTRYKILRALNSLRSQHPDLTLDVSILDRAIGDTLCAIFRLLDWRLKLADATQRNSSLDTPIRRVLIELLSHKELNAIERLFRLFQLRHGRENFQRIHRGTLSDDRSSRASSRELLEMSLQSPVREAVLGLLDELPDSQRLAHHGRYYDPISAPPEEVLRLLLSDGGVPVKCLVAHHIGELRLVDFSADLRSLVPEASDSLKRAIDSAVDMLDGRSKEAFYAG